MILGIFFLIWMAYRYLQGSWANRVKKVEQQAPKTPLKTMKACAYCKTHIPEDDGIEKDGLFFCSYQHLDRYQEHLKK